MQRRLSPLSPCAIATRTPVCTCWLGPCCSGPLPHSALLLSPKSRHPQITWHLGLFLALTLGQIGVQGRKQGYF
jgi:hypothetical protein